MRRLLTTALLSCIALGGLRNVEAAPVGVTIGAPIPDPAIQGGSTTFRYALINSQRATISGKLVMLANVADCTVPSCITTLPSVTLRQTNARTVRGQVSVPPLRGRRAYTLHIEFQPSDSSSVTHATRDFYVETPDEQSDAFRNGVDVYGPPQGSAFCDKTNYGWRFERDELDHLRAFQPYNQCTGQPQAGWMTLGGGRLGSVPALALSHGAADNWPNDRIHLFYRGSDGQLWTWVWDNKPFNSDPMSLGGPITSAPTAISVREFANRVEVFYRGAGSKLMTRRLDIGQSWGGEKVLATGLDSAPAASSFRFALDLVVYRGQNKHLWLITRDRRTSDPNARNNAAPWSAPSDLGGLELKSAPGISVKSDGTKVVVEYRGPDDKVWESSWDGKEWWSAPYNTTKYP